MPRKIKKREKKPVRTIAILMPPRQSGKSHAVMMAVAAGLIKGGLQANVEHLGEKKDGD